MRTRRPLILILVIALTAVVTLPALAAQTESSSVNVLIRTGTNVDAVMAAVENAGGEITGEYDYLDVIAAEIPPGQRRLGDSTPGRFWGPRRRLPGQWPARPRNCRFRRFPPPCRR